MKEEKEKPRVKCPHCGHEWVYGGGQREIERVCCPKCGYKYVLKSLKREFEKVKMND